MKSLHIVPGDSSGGSLRQALEKANCSDDVAVCLDDLSCGPISSDEVSRRAAWWAAFDDRKTEDLEMRLADFWASLTQNRRLIVWIGRQSAREHAFLLAFADRVQRRPFDIIDVTDLRFARAPDKEPGRCVALVSSDELSSLIGTEQTIAESTQMELAARWHTLKAEDANFRIATNVNVTSVGDDHFDPAILSAVTSRPSPVNRVIHGAMFHKLSYLQVGAVMLSSRLAVLVRQGRVKTDGDVKDSVNCKVWSPSV